MLNNMGYSGSFEMRLREFQRHEGLFELGLVEGKVPNSEFPEFANRHGLSADDTELLRDYRRLALLFEAVREGGFWSRVLC